MTGPVRMGVLGCGSFARQRMLPALREHQATTVTAVASRDPDRAARLATEIGCAAADYRTLLSRDDVDAVYLSLPPALHAEWTARALAAGKHVLVEKPLAGTGPEAAEVVGLARRHRLVLRENLLFPHHPQHRAVRELVASGRLGEIRSMRSAFCIPARSLPDVRYVPDLGGGALLDLAVYPVRAALLLLGNDLRLAGAVLRIDPRLGVDMSGQALLVSDGGVAVHVEFGFEHSYGSRYSLWGSRASLTVDRAFTPPRDWRPVLRVVDGDGTDDIVLPHHDQLASAIGSFTDAVTAAHQGRQAPDQEQEPLLAAMRTAELLDAIRADAMRVRSREVAVACG